MRAFILDPVAKTVEPIELPDGRAGWQEAKARIGVDSLDSLRLFNGVDRLWVDDEGFNTPGRRAFYVKGYDSPLCGTGIILGLDAAGELTSPSVEIEEVRRMVIWTGLETSGEREPDSQKMGELHGQPCVIHTVGGPVLRPAP